MKIAIGCDHGGFAVKGEISEVVNELGHEVLDRGCDSARSVNYPDYAEKVCRDVESGGADRGILVQSEGDLEPLAIAKCLKKICDDEQPGLVILGKQAIDGDNN
ncbi:MAG: RpiB/LacA/LacB family sugar-phosphate isomerase, partial [Desulfurivibrionaceae bacterium]|nr:RpiB/LacA/LacB family sugar-phosphate isomerase [Desulfurivibrionaceae bacterium]